MIINSSTGSMRLTCSNVQHYNKSCAKFDVSRMSSVSNGVRYDGEFWIIREIREAYKGYVFPARTTDYDKYAAVNFVFHKLHDKYNDEQILEIAYRLFFADRNTSGGEVWNMVNGSC